MHEIREQCLQASTNVKAMGRAEDLNTSDPFDEGLVYEANLPLAWRLFVDGESPRDEHLNLGNEQTLRLLAAVEEFYPEGADEHSHNHEYARLELKLNLLLELVGELLTSQRALPPSRPLRLNAHALEWEQREAPPAPGARLLAELFLSLEVPRPVRLVVQVQQVRNQGDTRLVTTLVEELSEPVVDLLEKFIFRRHRRSIAHSRPKTDPAGG